MARFIAEISSNHNGDKGRCLELIRAAAACGCWGVKFQLFRIEKLFAPEILQASEIHRLRRRWELPLHFLSDLAACARDEGLAFGCTPFDMEAVDVLGPYVDFLKIASYELPWLDLVRGCGSTGLPMMMSCGMADETEIRRAVVAAEQAGCRDLTVFHCVSNYPAAASDCNLAAMGSLRGLLAEVFPSAAVGWSDHSVDPGVVSRAVEHWGAEVVEFHFDLEGEGEEFSGGHCWLPDRIQSVIAGQGDGLSSSASGPSDCDGSPELTATDSESDERLWRADPTDGLRPIKVVRQGWQANRVADDDQPLVLMLAGGPGLGHLARLLALAEVLRADHEARILFLVPDSLGAEKLLARHGFEWRAAEAALDRLIKLAPSVCVFDLKEPCVELVEGLADEGISTVVIDRPDCPAADLGIVPCYDWQDQQNASRIFGGPEYLLVRSDITRLRPTEVALPGPRIVVSFGGEDPYLLTEKTARALATLPDNPPVDFVVGPGFNQHRTDWPSAELDRPNYRLITTNDPLETILPAAGLLVTAMGVTIAEAQVLGVPTAVLANYGADDRQVGFLVAAGSVADLGFHARVTDGTLSSALATLWADTEKRHRLAVAGWHQTDGQGARRAIELMAPLLKNIRPLKDGAC